MRPPATAALRGSGACAAEATGGRGGSARPDATASAGSGVPGVRHARPSAQGPRPERAAWVRCVGNVLARVGLALAAVSLGVVTLVAALSTVWLMTSSDDGNLTQSMSVYTVAGGGTWAVLAAGVAGGLCVLGLCVLAYRRGSALDGRSASWGLALGTLALQLALIASLRTWHTYWGDSWMINGFVNHAINGGGIAAIFEGPYRTLFFDARLYFACYPFQASLFWLMYALKLAFGTWSFVALQVISALANTLAVLSLLTIGRVLCPTEGSRRVLWALVAACLPMYWLSTFLYGNAIGCGLALAFLACQARSMTVRGARGLAWGAASVVPLALALCIKATFVLFAIGAVLAWAVVAACRKEPWGLVVCALSVAVARSVSGLPFESLRSASGGYEFGDALTTLNHLELGLRMGTGEFYVSVDDGPVAYAPGGWSNHANAVWAATGEDASLQDAVAVREIASDLLGFASDPAHASWFFSVKLATEWADPTYQALYYLSECGDPMGARPNPADLSTPFGATCTVLTFMLDGYQTVTFAAALAFVARLARRWGRVGTPAPAGSEPGNPVALLLAAVFFTGFGCYLLWEAKAVYVLPFAIVMLPLSSAGLAHGIQWMTSTKVRLPGIRARRAD